MRRLAPTLSLFSALFLLGGTVGCSSGSPANPDSGRGSGGVSGSGGSGSGGTSGSGGSGTGGSGGGSGGASGSGGSTDAGSGGATDGGTDAPRDATGETAGEAGGGDGGGMMTFTSSGLRMMGAGLVFPAVHSASTPSSPQTNQSPPFAWSGAPAGTMSFAITLHDLSANGTHWVIHDIPATVNMLPQNLPRMRMLMTPVMARQKAIYGDMNGYEGPGGGGTNNYEFELWALNVATLPANVAAMSPAQMRTNAMGLTQYRIGSVKIMARGTRGGL